MTAVLQAEEQEEGDHVAAPVATDDGQPARTAAWSATCLPEPVSASWALQVAMDNMAQQFGHVEQHVLRCQKKAEAAAKRAPQPKDETAPKRRKVIKAACKKGSSGDDVPPEESLAAASSSPLPAAELLEVDKDVPANFSRYVGKIQKLPRQAWPLPSSSGAHNYTLGKEGFKGKICVRPMTQPMTFCLQLAD